VANQKEIAALRKGLHEEVDRIKRDYSPLKIDNAFVLWFADAYILGDRDRARDGVIGGPGDKTVDAVYVDERDRIIHLVQGKYHRAAASDDPDVYKFAKRARDFWNADFDEELKHAGPGARKKLQEAHVLLHGSNKEHFQVKMYFATTGRVSANCKTKAKQIAAGSGRTGLEVLDQHAILAQFSDWLEGSSPPLPELEIGVDGAHTLIYQEDNLQGWIFTTTSQEVNRLHKFAGERLFARNVRGYLGSDGSINKEIGRTSRNKPELFWFLNNGITIVANHVEKRDSGKQVWMRMTNPQVVNGQQTVRTLAAAGRNRARVLVRLIRLEQQNATEGIVGLVGEVVRATNRQNAIKQADLMANDTEQVRIERDFRKLNYAYERKRQDVKEFSEKAFKHQKVRKEDLANALSATILGPHTVRRTAQWEEKYHRLFSNSRPITDYLVRWWASRQVAHVEAVPIEARWVVLASVWDWSDAPVREAFGREAYRHAFLRACQNQDNTILRPLHAAAKQLYICSRAVYLKGKKAFSEDVKRSGKPFRVLTPDAFFRREHVGEEVTSAARKDARRKNKITSLLKKFRSKLEDSL
jgi:AIPR protein